MSAHVIASHSYEVRAESLQNLKSLLYAYTADQSLAKVVAVGICHEFAEIFFDFLNDEVESIWLSLLQKVLHLSRSLLSFQKFEQVVEVRDLTHRVIVHTLKWDFVPIESIAFINLCRFLTGSSLWRLGVILKCCAFKTSFLQEHAFLLQSRYLLRIWWRFQLLLIACETGVWWPFQTCSIQNNRKVFGHIALLIKCPVVSLGKQWR